MVERDAVRCGRHAVSLCQAIVGRIGAHGALCGRYLLLFTPDSMRVRRQNIITSVAAKANTFIVASGSHDSTVRIWDVRTSGSVGT